ncbi:hypothetical protein [Streptomyces boncukensis]|uniref:DUF7848 domain-containing protein n=1 Tax=Streptomyces boncukensis TaxID=2711219 RepID=A0A6G4WQH8_9ACTN|nr:hypothetical protein [Streptomyces boncukensis]NGO67455.1 hypothetical protein [Streptomyces boncukensis]
MSTGERAARARFRYAEWALEPVTDAPVTYTSRCHTCGEPCAERTDADTAERAALKHVGRTHHADFELSASRPYRARLTDPTGGAPPRSP